MSDHATRQAKRSGGLAAQLAAEVRAGRPERCRLRAYCGCKVARHTYGHVAWSCGLEADDCRAAWCAYHHGELFLCAVCNQAEVEPTKDCPGYSVPECNLPDWLTGLQRLAWAPPLWVPCSVCEPGSPASLGKGKVAWNLGYMVMARECPQCSGAGKVPANVDPAQWVLTVAACGVARAAYRVKDCGDGRWSDTCGAGAPCSIHAPIKAAIQAAEQWTRCPCRECLTTWQNAHDATDLAWLFRPDGNWDAAGAINATAQIIGPDAAREAAARAVLEVV